MHYPKHEVLTVSQLTLAIKQRLEGHFFSLSVQGEISNLKEQSSGHIYFTLKDAQAQISAVLFKGNARTLAQPLKNGDQVIAKGAINVYPPRGNYQLIIRELSLIGIGNLLLKLHEIKLKLQEKGWFDSSRKKNLPKYPKTIGIVTSPTSSVIQDILHVLTRRLCGFHLILNPVKVQGEGAAEEIALAIEQFNRFQLADVLIVGRGGGSLEDLWAFNEECVADAIYYSQIPIVSAVGHETDYCIADFVADMRAPTPSAAAEIITTETTQQLHFLNQSKKHLEHITRTLLYHNKKQLLQFQRHPYLSSPYLFLALHLQCMDDITSHLKNAIKNQIQKKALHLHAVEKQIRIQNPKNQIAHAKTKIISFDQSLRALLKQQLSLKQKLMDPLSWQKKYDQSLIACVAEKKRRFLQLIAHLKSIDPKNLLTKGFCIAFQEKTDSIIHSIHHIDDKVRILLQDGQALLKLEKINPHKVSCSKNGDELGMG